MPILLWVVFPCAIFSAFSAYLGLPSQLEEK
jgi:hypothetical protein